jgi:hypothetical protein
LRNEKSNMSTVDALIPHLEEIALAMRDFLGRVPPNGPRFKEDTAVIEEAASLLRGKNVK